MKLPFKMHLALRRPRKDASRLLEEALTTKHLHQAIHRRTYRVPTPRWQERKKETMA